MIRRIIRLIVLSSSAVIFAGCATTTNPVSIFYIPSVAKRGGSGELLVKVPNRETSMGSAEKILWAIGKRKDADGNVTGEILSAYSAEDMGADALRRELTSAGYRVEPVSLMRSGAPKGVDLTSVQVDLDETDGIPKTETIGKVKVSLDIWKNGVMVKKLSYESKVSDFAVVNRDRLQREMVERGLRGVMSQAVPDILSVLERQSVN